MQSVGTVLSSQQIHSVNNCLVNIVAAPCVTVVDAGNAEVNQTDFYPCSTKSHEASFLMGSYI